MSVSFVVTDVDSQSRVFNAEAQRAQSKQYRGRQKYSFSFSADLCALCASVLNAVRMCLRISGTSR